MNQMSKQKLNWDETREYFKEKTNAFTQVKKRNQIEIMKKELDIEIKNKYNKKINE